MSYITQAEFSKRFGESELEQLTEGNDFNAAAEDAANTIDGYLAGRYTLPLVSVPGVVVGLAADIARYRLWDERAPEEVRRRYEDALQQLRDLAAGRMSLPPGSDGEPQAQGGADMDGFSADRVFTMDSLRCF